MLHKLILIVYFIFASRFVFRDTSINSSSSSSRRLSSNLRCSSSLRDNFKCETGSFSVRRKVKHEIVRKSLLMCCKLFSEYVIANHSLKSTPRSSIRRFLSTSDKQQTLNIVHKQEAVLEKKMKL